MIPIRFRLTARPARWLSGAACIAALTGALFVSAKARAEAPGDALFTSGQGGYHTYRIPALTVTKSGTLLAFCEGRGKSQGDSGDIDILWRRSTDGGRTWSPSQLLWEDAGNTCGNPCAVVDAATGKVWLLLTWNRGDDHEPDIIAGRSHDTRRVFVTHSDDEGLSWARPREITADVKLTNWTWYATGPGAGIQLQRGSRAGRLVIPCDHIESGTKRYFSHVIYSDNHGANWRLGGTTPKDLVNECEVAELADGALLLNMRSYDPALKARQTAVGHDGGMSWGEQRVVPELPDPICQASLRRLRWPEGGKPGVLLFANAASGKRERLTVRASFDDGRTWPVSRLITAQPAAYSCLAALPDGRIGLLYETGAKNPYAELRFTTFALDSLSPATP